MTKLNAVWIPLCTLAATTATLSAAGPGKANDFQGRRVLIIGIDGLRPDGLLAAKAPAMQAMAKAGTATWKAVAGGELGGATQQPTISGPGWATILTGTYSNKHGLVGNATNAYNQQPVPKDGSYQIEAAPHFARRLKESVATASVASIISWGWIEDYFVAAQPQYLDFHIKTAGKNYLEQDKDVKDQTVKYLASSDPDVLFLHFSQVDGAGHSTGFSTGNPKYLASIETIDGYVADVLDAVRKRPKHAEEDWLVILTTDHGGNGRSHGGQSTGEREIPMIVAGHGSSARGVVDETPGYHVVPATTFQFLGVPVKPAWGWEPGTFGLGGKQTAADVKPAPKS